MQVFTRRIDFQRINILRGIAVLCVLLFHTNIDIFRFGYLGVDLFFSLSGFVIYSRYFGPGAPKFSFRDFYISRILRLGPTLILTIFLLTLILKLYLLPSDVNKISKEAITAIFGVSNLFYLRHNDYFSGASAYDPLIHTWSLGVEEQFYLILPISLLVVRRLVPKKTKPIFFGILLIFSVVASLYLSLSHPGVGFYLLPGRLFEFLIGIFTGYLIHRETSINNLSIISILTLTFFLIFVFGIYQNDFLSRLILLVVTSCLILSRHDIYKRMPRFVLNPLITIGVSSYGIYLIHQPIFVFARLASTQQLNNISYTYLILLAITTGILITKKIENPIRQTQSRRTTLVLLFLCTSLLVLQQTYTLKSSDNSTSNTLGDSENRIKMQEQYKWGKCFITPKEYNNAHLNSCLPTNPDHEKYALVWGDSHAASIGSGIAEIDPRFSFMALASCPPILDSNLDSNCKSANRRLLNSLRKRPPSLLILEADWQSHSKEIKPNLFNSIKSIQKALPTSRILLLGSLPRWSPSLAQQILRLKISPTSDLNLVVSDPFGMKSADKSIKEIADKLNLDAIILSQVICKNYSCPAILNIGGVRMPTVYDDAHLTEAGSQYYGKEIIKILRSLRFMN